MKISKNEKPLKNKKNCNKTIEPIFLGLRHSGGNFSKFLLQQSYIEISNPFKTIIKMQQSNNCCIKNQYQLIAYSCWSLAIKTSQQKMVKLSEK
jgi:hypothetical protein